MNILGGSTAAQRIERRSMWQQHQRSFDLFLIAVAVVIVWQVFFYIGGSLALASPLQATRTAIAMLGSADFWIDIRTTFSAFAYAVVIESVLGVLLGAILGLRRLTGDVLEPMIASTLNGLDRVPKVLRKTAQVFQLSKWDTVRLVILPSAAPAIFNGVKLAIAQAFVGVLGAEFILSTGGLGYQIFYAFHNFDNRTMYAIVLLVLIIVSIVNMALLTWERRLRQRRGLG